MLCKWRDAVQLFIGGGSNGASLIEGQAYLDDFKVTQAQLIGWPPASDIYADGFIDYMDLEVMCENWLAGFAEERFVDFTLDGRIDFKDFAELARFWLQANPIVDVAPPPTGDGIVDTLDLSLFASYWLTELDIDTSILGDINQDGIVNLLDLAELGLAW